MCNCPVMTFGSYNLSKSSLVNISESWIQGSIMYIRYSPGHFIVSIVHMLPQLRGVSLLTAIYCKENLFSRGVRDALIYEHNSMLLGVSMNTWQSNYSRFSLRAYSLSSHKLSGLIDSTRYGLQLMKWASDPILKQLVTLVTLVTLLYRWAYLVRSVTTVAVRFFSHLGDTGDYCSAPVHLLAL